MIACRTTIGYGAPTKAGKSSAHGSPLGAEEIEGAREKLGWSEPPFDVPADVRELWRKAGARSQALHAAWNQRLAALDPEQRAEFVRRMRGDLPKDKLAGAVRAVKEKLAAEPREIATRIASESALEALTAGGAGDDRRLRRPDRLEQHPRQGHDGALGRQLRRPLHPLRHPRARHGGGDERHGAAWRRHSVFRHLPGVLRLCAPGDPPRRADGRARHPRHDARLDRAGRGRPDPPAGRASRGAARDPEHPGVPPVRRGRDRRVLAAGARSARPRRACWR